MEDVECAPEIDEELLHAGQFARGAFQLRQQAQALAQLDLEEVEDLVRHELVEQLHVVDHGLA